MIEELSKWAAVALTVSIGIFTLRYGAKAPWWKSFEGRVIFVSFSFFFLTMLNLVVFLFTRWGGYRCGMFLTMTGATVAMIYMHVSLSRARRKVRDEERHELLRRLNP